MNNKDLSILIPARNEQFLQQTIEDILKNREADTEIIVTLDGQWPVEPLKRYDDVKIIYVNQSVGQRAATNLACKLSKAKYVAKADAHCAFDKGFDRKMLEFFEKVGDETMGVPIMRNLWAFDWKCMKCGKKWYQGPTPIKCQETNFKGTGEACTSDKFEKKMMWIGKTSPQSTSYCFDSEPHFQYFQDYKKTQAYRKDRDEKGYTKTMSLQGSFFMLTRDLYWKLNVSDENLGSWGNQGIELALKMWLSGRQVLVNHNTWYAHMFRTQGGDFSFPYRQSGNDVQRTKNRVKDLFWKQQWEHQIHPVSWLVEKFWPVFGWTQEDLEKLKTYETT